MNRFLILLVTVCFLGCSGEKSGDDKSSDSGKDNPGGTATADSKKPSRGETDSGSGSRVRTENFFGRGKEMNDMNKLKIIGLAMHNFHDVYRKFATAPLPEKSELRHPSLSWRVSLLPYVELANEYEQFDRKQPWDSAQNKALVGGKGKEPFVLSNGNLICNIKCENQAKAFRDILDGSSNTVMLLENPTADGDKWTQTVDITDKDAVKIVKSLKKGEYLLALMYDGSTTRIHSTEGKNLSDEDIMAVFGHRDGTITKQEIFQPSK